ncbi:transposase [Streptomyces sp. NPDC058240]|uniref:transposase n=1 Tax=Streptomyces sp. NPDC058240 TaxID=3346396 RepID=UPI0036EC7968
MPTSTLPGPEKGLRNRGLGRSRGGLTSKIHLACDALGRPLAFTVTGGNTNDCTQFTAVMDAIPRTRQSARRRRGTRAAPPPCRGPPERARPPAPRRTVRQKRLS